MVPEFEENYAPQQPEMVLNTHCPMAETGNDTNRFRIINLSTYQLSQIETNLLTKGLSFSPMIGLDKFELTKDIYLFCRQLTFKMLYHQPSLVDELPDQDRQTFRDLLDLLSENDGDQGRRRFNGRLPSQATPKFSMFPTIQIFFETTCRNIKRLQLDKHGQNNLTKEEKLALSKLKNNDLIEIKESDKGGNIVLWPKDMYLQEARRQLDSAQYYQKLPSDPTLIFKNQLDKLITGAFATGTINKRERDYLITTYPAIPTFYLVPKVHKSIDRPPGRPIISGLGGLYEKPCSYLDFFLQPLVKSLDSYVRDSSHLIEICESLEIPDNAILVTLDVEALYTNIGHDLDLQLKIDHNRIITTLYRKRTATNNLLHFDSFHPMHLKRGIPKGQFLRLRRNCSRTEDFLEESRHLTNRFREQGYPRRTISKAFESSRERTREEALRSWIITVRVSMRGLFVWRSSCTIAWKLQEMFSEVPNISYEGLSPYPNAWIEPAQVLPPSISLANGISFTISHSPERMNFLDTLVIKNPEGLLSTDLYSKSTDRNSLLHFESLHPPSTKKSIPRAQYQRVQRIVSDMSVRESQIREMTHKFEARGYPLPLLEDSKTTPNKPKSDTSKRIPFVHAFHPSSRLY
ncbi:uncharacterized protein LOC143785095 [Ranitomeya variabilis]|uniref:uncharacterized protein LOC143785095 n=1 Tax=Ranitomeya variabilis TaxID=490064 RepID=UPI0040562DF9